MPTDVVKDTDLIVLASYNEQRLTCRDNRKHVTRLSDILLKGDSNPVATENLFILARQKGIVRVNTDLSKRVALIIGNSDYSANVGPLRNPVNDARTMAQALEEVGFEVTRLENVKYREMREAVRDFGSRLRKSDAALFYFSGHGVQFEGGNYLLPIGAEIEIPRHISYEALSENEVLAEMEGGTKDRVNLVIVDACRNNLVTRGFRSASKGLAQPEFHPSGSLIAYATAPGKVAAVTVRGRTAPTSRSFPSTCVLPDSRLKTFSSACWSGWRNALRANRFRGSMPPSKGIFISFRPRKNLN